MRKGLVIIQFTISVILIIATVVIYQQIQYVKSRDLGYSTNRMIELLVPGSLPSHFSGIRDELLQTGLVENAALTWNEPLHMYSSSDEYTWRGKSPRSSVTVYDMGVSAEYIATMKMKLLQGRDFYPAPRPDSSNAIINETFAKLMGDQGKIGSYIYRKSPSVKAKIIGIVKDFVFNDMYGSGGPVMIMCAPQFTNLMVITFKPDKDLKEAIAKTDRILKASSPGYPFEYLFVDELFNKLFETENLIGNLATVFSALAIMISCLGLFGLAAYTAERRKKEIGIRKVLGASVASLTKLLSFEFLKLVALSCILAFPIVWWALHSWLQDYQYRIAIHWWVFLIAALTAILIAVCTVTYQAIKAAFINPIKSLRTE